jgi:dCMP deaminase
MSNIARRIDWTAYALFLAWVASQRSESFAGTAAVKVGAAALDRNNRVIGLAYNGLPPGKSLRPPSDGESFIIHAVTNLCTMIPIKAGAGIVAVTTTPCASCAAELIAHGVETVVYDPMFGETDKKGIEFLEFYGVRVTPYRVTDLLKTWVVPAIDESRGTAFALYGKE